MEFLVGGKTTPDETNSAPEISDLADLSMESGSSESVVVTFSDNDADDKHKVSVVVDSTGGGGNLSIKFINADGSKFSLTAADDFEGVVEVTVKVSDGTDTDDKSFKVTVTPSGGADPFGTPVVYPNNTFTILGTVTIDGATASKGDVVAAYVGDELRGKQAIEFVVQGVAYLTMQVYVDTASDKTSKFVVWDADQTDEELKALTLKRAINLEAGGQLGTATDLAGFDFKSTVIQEVSLNSGWNLISFYVETDDMAPAVVLASIKDQLSQIKNLTQSYDPSLPFFLNTLTSLNVKDGYWVKVKEDVSFEVEGTVPEGASISVRKGWNLVGYPRESGAAPASELTSLGNTVVQIKNLTQSYDPSLPFFLNTLTTMAPGLGYWLKLTEDGTWTVGDVSNDGADRNIFKMTSSGGSHWGRVVVYPKLGATVLAEVSVEGDPVAEGSMVAAHVGDELRAIGKAVLSVGRSYVTLNVSLDAAEQVTFRILDAGTGREYRVADTMQLEMGETYGKGQLVKLDGTLSVAGRIFRIGEYVREPFGFSFETVEGKSYVVEFSLNLKQWGELQNFKGTGKPINFIDSRRTQLPSSKSFYRVRLDQ